MRYMNPIEEAKELVDKFTVVGLQQREEGYQCALIAVDTILDFIKFNVVPYTYDKDSMKAVIDNKQHYIKVKKEIEKLNN
jgi:hypothetical protein